MKEDGKIFTYQFNYTSPDDSFTEIQFCATSKEEAIDLFQQWAEENSVEITEYNVEIVYNQEDADEYGPLYGAYVS